MQKFNKGDRVNVQYCDELSMPCFVEGLDVWMPCLTRDDGSVIYMYRVIGTHKRGNQISVRVSEAQLTHWQE